MDKTGWQPLTAQVLSKATMTTLVQTLSDDPEARVTGLDAAPLERADSRNRYERLHLTWSGPKGSEEQRLILKVLPELTWGEAIQPDLPAPAEVMLVESDLAPAFNTVIEDGTVAAGRRRRDRPAWVLSEDFYMMKPAPRPITAEQRALVLAKMARFHALHWGAVPVLNQVYPWLPRFSRWLECHCASIAQRLDGAPDDAGDSRYERWLLQDEKRVGRAVDLWRNVKPAEPLRSLLHDPRPLIEALETNPQSIIHGNWQLSDCFVTGRQLVVTEWDRVQLGPPAWDLYCFLEETATGEEEALPAYQDELAAVITELEREDRDRFHHSLALCRVAAALLLPDSGAADDLETYRSRLNHAADAARQLFQQ